MKIGRILVALATILILGLSTGIAADPWIITSNVVVTEATEVGDVIVVEGGSLTVRDVPEPGFRISGNVWAIGDARVRFENSAIRFLSSHHGQYSLAGIDRALIEIIACDYRVPGGVQHGLVIAGEGMMVVEDTDFDPVQLVSVHTAQLEARRLNGEFEVIVQNDSAMKLEDIPRHDGEGSLWVWVEFPSGSEADFTPPMPGFVDAWTFPPPEATGIVQSVELERCRALLWPMLVRQGCRLTLRDIDEANRIVVGLYLPDSTLIEGLVNDLFYEDVTLDLADRNIRLVNASIDTWNLYPEGDASIDVRDSVLGEILSFDNSRVLVRNTTIDGTGGFFGARGNSTIRAFDSLFTCTIEATQDTTIELHNSVVEPYPFDLSGLYTRFGAYEYGRLLADATSVATTPALGGDGIIALSYFTDPPAGPPQEPDELRGTAAVFGLEGGPTLETWRLEVVPRLGGLLTVLAEGVENVEEGRLGDWGYADSRFDHVLRLVLRDSLGRELMGFLRVPGADGVVRDAGSGNRAP